MSEQENREEDDRESQVTYTMYVCTILVIVIIQLSGYQSIKVQIFSIVVLVLRYC